MRLFKYEGYRVTVSPEALLLKPFKRIWDRDRSESKLRAMLELAFIYFYCDPRSDYMIFSDEETRQEEIKKGEGMKDTWAPDKLVLEAIEMYKTLMVTPSSALLTDARAAIDKIRQQLRDISFEGIEPAKIPKAIKDTSDALTRIPELIEAYQKAEKTLNSEIQEKSRIRGGTEKKIFDEGLDL